MGIFTKIAATVIGTRIAADSGKSGVLGVAAGMLATRVIARSPMGALLVGGTYVAHKLLTKKREIDALGPHGTAVKDGLAEPVGTQPHGTATIPSASASPVEPQKPVPLPR